MKQQAAWGDLSCSKQSSLTITSITRWQINLIINNFNEDLLFNGQFLNDLKRKLN